MTSPRSRMLRLLSLFQTGRRWPAAELAQAMDANPRTLRRDIDHLRELGYPVESIRGPGGYYRLTAGKALPPLMLDDEEAAATMLGLTLAASGGAGIDFSTNAAERAAAKLRRILPERPRRSTDDMLATVEIAATGHPQPSPELLGRISDAIAGHRILAFDYEGTSGWTQRRTEPIRLIRLGRRWYLFAWDTDRDGWRNFRLDRFEGIPTSGAPFVPRPLPAENPVDYLRERFRGAPAHRVVLTLHATVQEAASRLHRIDGDLEPLHNHRCRYTAYVDSYEWLAHVLVVTDIEFTVEQPQAFRDHLTTHAERLLRGAMPAPSDGE